MKKDWQHWIEKLGDKDLTEEEVRAFQEEMLESPENIDDYLDDLLPETVIESSHLDRENSSQRDIISFPQSKKRNWKVIFPAAAASVALLCTVSYFLGQQPQQVATPHLATITDSNALAEGVGINIGQPLYNQEISLPEGANIGIAMRDGALLDIHGPASFHINDSDLIELHSGRIAAYAPEYAQGFTINTDEGKIVDLGTRFVTTTGTELGTEVHVVEGLVEAFTTAEDSIAHSLTAEKAVALKDGSLSSIEYLEKRLYVPLNPILPDSDGDGFADIVETHYSKHINDPLSKPQALRAEEPFANYPATSIKGQPILAQGYNQQGKWIGWGTFHKEGLNYQNNGIKLVSSGGSLATTGTTGEGAVLIPNAGELPKKGVTYISFLMQQPTNKHIEPFSGLLLFNDTSEELFVGELSTDSAYGARLKESSQQDPFTIPSDNKTHLFVIRIDHTRFLTDIFVDPPLNQSEKEIAPQIRYHDTPTFDRIVIRSGSRSGDFPVKFDEVRCGINWRSILPLQE